MPRSRETRPFGSELVANVLTEGTKPELIKCTGVDDCCKPERLCGENEGDCDSNKDCKEGLTCGLDNCTGSTFDKTDDCCMFSLLSIIFLIVESLLKDCLASGTAFQKCDGHDSCCRKDYLCGINEGDCDSDADCKQGLKCGLDNCSGPNFDSEDDCCRFRHTGLLCGSEVMV